MYVFFIRAKVQLMQQFIMYKLDLQHKYRVSSIEHNSGIVGYRRNFGIDPALTKTADYVLVIHSPMAESGACPIAPAPLTQAARA